MKHNYRRKLYNLSYFLYLFKTRRSSYKELVLTLMIPDETYTPQVLDIPSKHHIPGGFLFN